MIDRNQAPEGMNQPEGSTTPPVPSTDDSSSGATANSVQQQNRSKRIAASFRDPSGYVFERDGQIYRAIDDDCADVLQCLGNTGLLDRLIDDRILIGTEFVQDPELLGALATEHPGMTHFLRHDRIVSIAYPYEWTVSMVADAGIRTIELQLRLTDAGYSLKDASAYNIQFVRGVPSFIDVSSIERPSRLDLWFALGQFGRMFTFPLILFRRHGWDFRSYFLGSIDGREVDSVVRSLAWWQRLYPGTLLDVVFPWLLGEGRAKSIPAGRENLEKEVKNSQAQTLNLRRLSAKLRRLRDGYKPKSHWADYGESNSYSSTAEQEKKRIVREFIDRIGPSRVLDVGCNAGEYSYLAAESGAPVVAIDADHDAVEMLYRRLKKEPADITPMVIDLGNPSPAIGHRNSERTGFFDRMEADCVLALALMHHLHVVGNLSIAAIRDQFHEMTDEHLIIEFVPTSDEMFQRLIKFRVDLYGGLTLESFISVFAERFELIKQSPVPGSERTLILFRKSN
jgi:SAM-dependent methyltransferase